MAIASLVLGIVGSVLAGVLASKSIIWPFIGLAMCIVGIVLGAKARKDPSQNRGLATAGMIVSIVGTVYCGFLVLYVIACAATLASFGGSLSDLTNLG